MNNEIAPFDGRFALAHFLQLVMNLLRTFCNFNWALLSHPNQEQLVIRGPETMTCTGKRTCAMKSVTFSLIVLLNVVQRSFIKCTIYMDYAMGIMFL